VDKKPLEILLPNNQQSKYSLSTMLLASFAVNQVVSKTGEEERR
jgi:hypothetical protein